MQRGLQYKIEAKKMGNAPADDDDPLEWIPTWPCPGWASCHLAQPGHVVNNIGFHCGLSITIGVLACLVVIAF